MDQSQLQHNEAVPITGKTLLKTGQLKKKSLNIALVGSSKSGKSTLLRSASRANQRMINNASLTAKSKPVLFKHNGYEFNIIELPGIHSLSGQSPDEFNARKYILGEIPDVLINVVNSEQLEKDLRGFGESQGLKVKQWIHPLRVFITGTKAGPPFFDTLELIGKTRCIDRIQRILKQVQENK